MAPIFASFSYAFKSGQFTNFGFVKLSVLIQCQLNITAVFLIIGAESLDLFILFNGIIRFFLWFLMKINSKLSIFNFYLQINPKVVSIHKCTLATPSVWKPHCQNICITIYITISVSLGPLHIVRCIEEMAIWKCYLSIQTMTVNDQLHALPGQPITTRYVWQWLDCSARDIYSIS